MIQQRREQYIEAHGPDKDGPWEEFFFGYESTLNHPASTSLDGWTADDLLTEALRREAKNTAALRIMQTRVLRTLLEGIDLEQRNAHIPTGRSSLAQLSHPATDP